MLVFTWLKNEHEKIKMITFLLFYKVTFLCWIQSDVISGNDNCPSSSNNLIRMCKPVTVTNKSHYTIEFSDFELTDEDSCQCSFIAPSHGTFILSPTNFTPVNNCGTKVEVSIGNVVINGGRAECRPEPPLPASVFTGEIVTFTVSKTSTSSRISPYCYVATFPTNVTFTCTGENQATTTTSASVKSATTASSISRTATASATSLSKSNISTRQSSRMTSMTMSSASGRTEVSTKTMRNELAEEKTCPTSGYVAGLALQSVIICVLIGAITILLWKRQKEVKKDEQSHVYMQSTSFKDVGNTDAYESIRNQSQNNIYLNTALAKD